MATQTQTLESTQVSAEIVTTNFSRPKSESSLSSIESLNSLSDQDIGQTAEIIDVNLGKIIIVHSQLIIFFSKFI